MSQIKKDYSEHITNLKIKGSIVGCILSIILVPFGISSDYLLYNEFFTEFLFARIICTVLTVAILSLHFHKTITNVFIQILSFSWLFLIQILICFMTITSNIFDLAYYNAIILLIFTATILLPLNVKEILTFCIASILIYLGTVLYTDITNFGIFYNNIFTLILASIIGVTATNVKSRLQFKHFCLNYKLKEKIKEIKETQRILIDSEKNEATSSLSAELIHEINNPLNFTITALKSLDRHNKINNDEELQDISSDLRIGAMRIKSTIDNLKNLSLLQKDVNKTDFYVLESIKTATRLKEGDLRKLNLKILIDKNLIIHASKTHFIQIIINLIENAIYSINQNKHVSPKITISAHKDDADISFIITDNGAKIEHSEIINISDDSIINSNENDRLDLNIATRLIKQHKGIVTIDTDANENRISFTIN